MKVLVVDDEAPARARLLRLLGGIEGVEVVGEARHGLEAEERLATLAPEVLLLDIEMPGLDGLALATRSLGALPVIFVTAHEEHAVRAFELAAVDYLLKPVSRARLVVALERARAQLSSAPPAAQPLRVVTYENETSRFFEAAAIERFRASDKYTVFTFEGVEHLTSESLSSLETRLSPLGFLRVHRSEVVRMSAVRAIGVRELELHSGERVRVSKRLAAQVRLLLRPA